LLSKAAFKLPNWAELYAKSTEFIRVIFRKLFANRWLGSFCKITAFSGQRTAFSLEWLGGLGKLGKDQVHKAPAKRRGLAKGGHEHKAKGKKQIRTAIVEFSELSI
jgi:hypothetical protein